MFYIQKESPRICETNASCDRLFSWNISPPAVSFDLFSIRSHIYCYIYLWWYHCLSIYGKIKSRGLPRTLLWIYHETRGSALIVRGPQGQGQLRHCWGSNDIFFHKYWRQWDPHRYIVFIVQIKTLDIPSIETTVASWPTKSLLITTFVCLKKNWNKFKILLKTWSCWKNQTLKSFLTSNNICNWVS